MNPKFLDKSIYIKSKKMADEKFEKNSAYKSMYLVKTYEKLGGKINPKLKNGKLNIWNKEKWKNLTPYALGLTSDKFKYECGDAPIKQKKIPSICRPTKKINKDTTSLAQEYNKKQIIKALEIKKKGNRINWDNL
tara:strand:- start:1062 stop:1466 length:405 start_codon:yes stop_codon:yes gene_type:complete